MFNLQRLLNVQRLEERFAEAKDCPNWEIIVIDDRLALQPLLG